MPTDETNVRIIPQTTYRVLTQDELEKPYRVIIENDDITPMDFVIIVLRTVFGLDFEQASSVMLTAHYEGRAHVVTLPYEEAQQRVYQAHSIAREAGFPLTFYLEPDE